MATSLVAATRIGRRCADAVGDRAPCRDYRIKTSLITSSRAKGSIAAHCCEAVGPANRRKRLSSLARESRELAQSI